jgi:hypothetical protein
MSKTIQEMMEELKQELMVIEDQKKDILRIKAIQKHKQEEINQKLLQYEEEVGRIEKIERAAS